MFVCWREDGELMWQRKEEEWIECVCMLLEMLEVDTDLGIYKACIVLFVKCTVLVE